MFCFIFKNRSPGLERLCEWTVVTESNRVYGNMQLILDSFQGLLPLRPEYQPQQCNLMSLGVPLTKGR